MDGLQICFIGAGNIAWSLIPACQQVGHAVNMLISRDNNKLDRFAGAFSLPNVSQHLEAVPPTTDVVFLTVSDQVIAEVASALIYPTHSLLIHVSGSTPLATLNTQKLYNKVGVFYPLQSFKLGTQVNLSGVPILLEGNTDALAVIDPLARQLSRHVYHITSEERLILHMGAVWVNNFTNLMYSLASEIVSDQQHLSFEMYYPLIHHHFNQLQSASPHALQTGPAIRKDLSTLQEHLNLLRNRPRLHELYKKLSIVINPELNELI